MSIFKDYIVVRSEYPVDKHSPSGQERQRSRRRRRRECCVAEEGGVCLEVHSLQSLIASLSAMLETGPLVMSNPFFPSAPSTPAVAAPPTPHPSNLMVCTYPPSNPYSHHAGAYGHPSGPPPLPLMMCHPAMSMYGSMPMLAMSMASSMPSPLPPPRVSSPLVSPSCPGSPCSSSMYAIDDTPRRLRRAMSCIDTRVGSSNTVAIDNKIEQAMDLVKSHLMFAVREEVEVLKEQIKELMERIGNLEWENTYLRANVPPEVLTRMAQTPRTLPSSSSS